MLLVAVTLDHSGRLPSGAGQCSSRGLALVGVGLGLFTPSNNAAIMSSAPKQESGVASGVLNMTRGMGTALGLALTGMVFGLVASPGRGLQFSLAFLAVVAVTAALVASLRGGRTAGGHPGRPGLRPDRPSRLAAGTQPGVRRFTHVG